MFKRVNERERDLPALGTILLFFWFLELHINFSQKKTFTGCLDFAANQNRDLSTDCTFFWCFVTDEASPLYNGEEGQLLHLSFSLVVIAKHLILVINVKQIQLILV